MKIVHISDGYTDGFSYQENYLAEAHKKLGYDVTIITTVFKWGNNGKIISCPDEIYYDKNGIKIIRRKFLLPCLKKVQIRLGLFKNLLNLLETESPNIIFKHTCEGMSLRDVLKYKKKHMDVRIFIDNHADFSNMSKKWWVKKFFYRGIWKYYIKKLVPYTERFYGVLPIRVNILHTVFEVPKEKIRLLVMGANDYLVDIARDIGIRYDIRKKHHVDRNDFLLMTGGKIDVYKRQVLLLMKAVKEMKQNVKLIIFGSIDVAVKEEFESLLDGVRVQYIGWLEADEIYKYFYAAELAVFPGRHSVIWEEITGLGVPSVFKYWEGMDHIDLGGNCRFLYEDSVEEMKTVLSNIIDNVDIYLKMKLVAQTCGMDKFSYQKIAENSIKLDT